MALDDITINGNKVATDKDGSNRHFQYAKMAWGADDTQTPVTATAPLPIEAKAGTALIGSVDVNEFPASSDVTDSIVARVDVATVANGLNAPLTVKFASISRNSSGAGTAIVAAVASKKIRVLSYTIVSTAAQSVKFQGDPAGTPVDLTGAMALAANGGVAPYAQNGLFESASGKALGLNLSASSQVSGHLSYVEV